MLCAALATGGCSSGAVDVEVPQPGPSVRAVCERLAARLPEQVQGQQRRDVEPSGPLVAAWGDPAIVLRCGVSRPPLDLTGEQPDLEVNGVGWQPIRTADGYVFTTVGRQVYVELRVPAKYAPEVNPLVDLASPVQKAVPTGSAG